MLKCHKKDIVLLFVNLNFIKFTNILYFYLKAGRSFIYIVETFNNNNNFIYS